jgi:hypothetical protein
MSLNTIARPAARLPGPLVTRVRCRTVANLWREREGTYLPLTIDVLRVTGGAITEIVTFHDDQFPRLGFAGAPSGGRYGVVPVRTLALRGGQPQGQHGHVPAND